MSEDALRAWTHGFAPALPTAGLVRLRDALAAGDERVRPGYTVYPSAPYASDFPPHRCCPVAFCGWADGVTSGQLSDFFNRTVVAADERLGAPDATRPFLRFVDWTDWDVVRAELGAEVGRELARRAAEVAV